MKGYILKVHYKDSVSGQEHDYYIGKDGYVKTGIGEYFSWEVYQTLKGAKTACTRKHNESVRNHEIEKMNRELRMKNGKELLHQWWIHEVETFEPVEVDVIGWKEV